MAFKVALNVSAAQENANPATFDLAAKTLEQLAVQLCLFAAYVPSVYASFFVHDYFSTKPSSKWLPWLLQVLIFVLAVFIQNIISYVVVLPMLLKGNAPALQFKVASLFFYGFNLGATFAMAWALKLVQLRATSNLREQKLHREKLETELKFLRAQVNPHFLFNTLNNIYSLSRKGSEHTSEAVMRLSKLMRFILYEASDNQILVVDEIRIIKDYIELEKLRYSSRLSVFFEDRVDNPHVKIGPLLLLHFVENAFKHGVSETSTQAEVRVHILVEKNTLKANFSNTKSGESQSDRTKIGLENIRRQLDLLYPSHKLEISNTTHTFTVSLELDLTI